MYYIIASVAVVLKFIFVGEFDKESSNFEREKSFCSDQKYKTQKAHSK